MDASHILVGGLTAISLALLVWMEIRSRRNAGRTRAEPCSSRLSRRTAATAQRPQAPKMVIMAEWMLIAVLVLALMIPVLGGFMFQQGRCPKCRRLSLDEHCC